MAHDVMAQNWQYKQEKLIVHFDRKYRKAEYDLICKPTKCWNTDVLI